MRALSILLSWLSRLCVLVLGMALILAYCSVYINPATTWIPAFFGLYFVPIVTANLLLLLIGLLRRSSAAWIPFICLLPALLFADLFVRWSKPEEAGPGLSLKIASYNVCNFQGYGNKTREETIREISRLLDREQIDIVCMQEFFYPDTAKIAELFAAYPYQCFSQRNPKESYRGNVIFSRYPIEAVGELSFPNSSRTCIYADISLSGRTIRVYTTHLESNNISLNALVDRIRKYQESPDEIIQAHRRIREAFLTRARQVEIIANHLQTVDMPFVFSGDFNDTPTSYTYYRLQKGLNDSFKYGGRGFGATFRYLWPALRIDYLFYNHAFTIRSHQTLKVPFSDHYPIAIELIVL
ncbi:MAG: endonuclease/exonuclease/phosphatase family protein [Bacteroidales bacterium]|nr:endonuclease/exonuclease/phosphatase family protein [Bacteroidales bacterium]